MYMIIYADVSISLNKNTQNLANGSELLNMLPIIQNINNILSFNIFFNVQNFAEATLNTPPLPGQALQKQYAKN